MLKVDPTLDHVPARREHVIALFESINQPLVNIPSFGTAPTGAFVLGTRNDQGHYTAFVYLYQPETRAVVVYVSEPRGLTTEQYRLEESEAIRFVESMGFMVDNVHFPTLAPPEQETVMGRIPMFRPPAPVADPYDMGASSADPFAATDQQLDAIFGGLSATDGELFRNAGVGQSSLPPPVPGGPAPTTKSRSTVPPPDFLRNKGGAALPGTIGGAGGISPPPPPMASAPPGRVMAGVPSSPPPGKPSSAPFGQPPVSPPPGSSPHNRPLDASGLERLGRLLGAFGVLFAFVGGGLSACKSGGTEATHPAVVAQLDIGNQHLAQRQFPDAIQAYQLALKDDENNRDGLRGIALAYMELGHYEDAERYYRTVLEVDGAWSMPKNELAVLLIKTGRCTEAEPLLREVLKDIFYPTPAFAEHNLARAQACQGDLEGAVDRLEKLMIKRPHFCLGYLTLADMSAQAKKHELTISACDDFAHNCEQDERIKQQVAPEHSDLCYLRKGLAYAELGDLESARAAFMRCQSKGQFGKECKKSLEMLPP